MQHYGSILTSSVTKPAASQRQRAQVLLIFFSSCSEQGKVPVISWNWIYSLADVIAALITLQAIRFWLTSFSWRQALPKKRERSPVFTEGPFGQKLENFPSHLGSLVKSGAKAHPSVGILQDWTLLERLALGLAHAELPATHECGAASLPTMCCPRTEPESLFFGKLKFSEFACLPNLGNSVVPCMATPCGIFNQLFVLLDRTEWSLSSSLMGNQNQKFQRQNG